MHDSDNALIEKHGEFKLTDILATLLRHRLKIVLVTGIGTLFWLLCLFLFPLLGVNTLGGGYGSNSITLEFIEFPQETKLIYNYDAPAMVAIELRDVSLLQANIGAIELEQASETKGPAQGSLKFDQLASKMLVTENDSSLTVSIDNGGSDSKAINSFLQRISKQAAERVGVQIKEKVAAKIGRIVESPLATEKFTSFQSGTHLAVLVVAIQELLDSKDFPLVYFPQAQLEQRPRISPALLLIAGLVFFLVAGLATAFLAEYIRNVRLDEKEMSKLRSAWKRDR